MPCGTSIDCPDSDGFMALEKLAMKKTTNICLNMIVKNETGVLPRLLKSVHAFIDYYVIVDTGSDDGTPELIKSEMERYGVDGEIHHREWVNFGHNRQQALELAVAAGKSDWLLFIDADEELGVSNPDFFQNLKPGMSYHIEKHHGEMRYAIPALINIAEQSWGWKGVVHNYLEPATDCPCELSKDIWIIYHSFQGAKSHGVTKEEKYLIDAAMLEQELKNNDQDTRSQFYLGQSYRNAGHDEKALEAYRKRSKMLDGWREEVFISLLEAGSIAIRLGYEHAAVIEFFMQAHEVNPARAEPLYRAAVCCRLSSRFHLAYLFAKAASAIDMPAEGLFINHLVYHWQRWDELAVAANQTGRHSEAVQACDKILAAANKGVAISETHLKRVRNNRVLSVRAMSGQIG